MADSFLGLQGKRVLVTGASSGIGRAVAISASEFGASVALLGRNGVELERTRSLMHGEGHSVVTADVSELGRISAAVGEAAASLGGLDSLVHCAGVQVTTPLKSLSEERLAELLTTNVGSALMIAKAFRAKQIPKNFPSIVLMSSVIGLVGQAGVSAYSATKGAVISMTKSLALELAREGIRVNCICPGVVQTEMTTSFRSLIGETAFDSIKALHPMGLGTPEDIANGAIYLISDAARWVTGTSLVIDGGYTAQ